MNHMRYGEVVHGAREPVLGWPGLPWGGREDFPEGVTFVLSYKG